MALVHVHFTVRTGRARLAAAHVPADQILAVTAEQAGIRFTLIDLYLAQVAGVARIAQAGERVVAVDASAPMARVRLTVVDVRLAGQARVAGLTFARVAGDRVVTDAAVTARL